MNFVFLEMSNQDSRIGRRSQKESRQIRHNSRVEVEAMPVF